jgi:predicted dehydrogenase
VDALNAGKHVYCEKPMVHAVEEGQSMIDAQAKSGKVLQIGSQYRSSLVYQKGHELMQANAIGKLNSVEAWLDRNTAIGAWEYSIPVDASPKTCDWERFQGNAPKRPWDPARFFRWRNFRDYGTGVAGDLFVHLLTGIHTVTGSLGPTRIYATGGTRYWMDREVPDVMLAALDYPETPEHPAFNVVLRVNFKSSLPQESFGLKFIGSDGVLTTNSFSSVEVNHTSRPEQFDYTIDSFAKPMQKKLIEQFREKNPPVTLASIHPNGSQFFDMSSQNAHLDHHRNFYASIRDGKPCIEDPTFGLRAAGPALMTNDSYFGKKIVFWDPQKMTISRT